MKKGNILIIDDNKSILEALKMLLKMHFIKVETLFNPEAIPHVLSDQEFDVVLLDMNFKSAVNSGNEGLFWLNKILEVQPSVSVVNITAYGDVELAVKAIKKGAVDFILKPWDNDKLLATLQSAYALSQSKKEVKTLKEKEISLIREINKAPNHMIGNSLAFRQMLNIVDKVAPTEANVLITGENGTGKELLARELHDKSTRSKQVFVSIDMGAIPETLFESELFGHVKGAFTDAKETRKGKFETANGGTLFLDEIGNLPLPLQSKLLNALQSRTITKVGSSTPVAIDIRLICATNANLLSRVEQGEFREDLLFRVNTIPIELPPLRDRKGDIKLLVNFFLKRYLAKYGKGSFGISKSALNKLENYAWPGNIRELQHTMERSVILSEGKELGKNDFELQPTSKDKNSSKVVTIEDMERELIENAIDRHTGNLSAVAQELGITRQTLYNKLKKYGL